MEKIDYRLEIVLMDGTPIPNIALMFIPDEHGCIGGVQVVRNKSEPVKRMFEAWVNLYPKHRPVLACTSFPMYAHASGYDADKCAGSDRIACVYIEKEFTEGEGL